MKSIRKTFLLIALSAFILSSCKKEVTPDIIDTGDKKKMTQLEVSNSFNWSTSKEIDVKIEGIPGAIEVNRTLTLHANDNVYFRKLFSINQNLTTKVIVPQTLQTLTLEFGSFVQTFDISGGNIVYSFLPVIEE